MASKVKTTINRIKLLALTLFFVGTAVFIYMQTGMGLFAAIGGIFLLFCPMLLAKPAAIVPRRHFYDNPSGKNYPGNYYGHRR